MGAPPRKGFSRICRGPFTGAVTRLIAHRGAAQEAPENSIAAFVDALGLGADGVELDVRCSADGALVVCHNPAIGSLGPIAELEVAQLPDQVPLLGEALAACGSAEVFVEIKRDPQLSAELLAAAVLEELAGSEARSTVSSFDLEVLIAARQLDLERGRAWLLLPGVDLELVFELALAQQLDALHLRHEVIDAGLVERTRASGLELAAWTVNESEELSRMAALGVDAVITDELSRARQLLEARGGQLGGGPVGGGPPPVS